MGLKNGLFKTKIFDRQVRVINPDGEAKFLVLGEGLYVFGYYLHVTAYELLRNFDPGKLLRALSDIFAPSTLTALN